MVTAKAYIMLDYAAGAIPKSDASGAPAGVTYGH